MKWISRFIGKLTGSTPAPEPPRETKPMTRFDFEPEPPRARMVHLDGSDMWASTGAGWRPPEHWLVKHPDGRITTPDGSPATLLKSSDRLPSGAGDFLNPKPCWDKDGKFIGWST